MRRSGTLSLVAIWLAALAGGAAWAGVLSVGPGELYATPCAAIAAAQDGDVIEVDAGTYAGDSCTI
ncbi:MAG TPA: hypothetical protein VFB81_11175, partial [Myxococcales bacterium]|nr:hypothetical protein [Myxococcales bacterium]